MRETVGQMVVVAGPDSGRTFSLSIGRSVLGRGTDCELAVRDAELEPHHLLIGICGAGTVELTQLSGRRPMIVDTQPAVTVSMLRANAQIELGASRLEWRPATAAPDDRHRQPILGYVDSGDRAFGVDAASPNRVPGNSISLPDAGQLTVVGPDIAAVLRALVGQSARAGWSVRSTFEGLACSIDGGERQMSIVEAGFDNERRLDRTDDADVVIVATDRVSESDHLDRVALGATGAAVVVGERYRGRYLADVNEFATTRVHLVGWHPATFQAVVDALESTSCHSTV